MILPSLPDLAPLTWTPVFFEASFDAVKHELVEWREEIHHHPAAREVSSLREGVEALPPLDGRRELLMQTVNDRWVAYFHSGRSPEGTAGVLSERLETRAVIVDTAPHTISADRKSGSWGGTRFEIRGPGAPYGYLRSVAAINDAGRWTWDSSGEPLPFEELDQYALPRIRDRLRPDMIERYCTALGIGLNDLSFYGPRGVLIENAGFIPSPYAKTLDQARADLRLGSPEPPSRPEQAIRNKPADGPRYVEEWRGEGEDIRALAAEFRRTFDRLSGAGVVIDSLILNYEDGHGTWEIVATITMSQAEAIGYDHEKRLWLESQKVYD